MPPGRPSKYTKEIGLKICEMLTEGYTLRQICNLDGIPGKTTIMRWLLDVSNKDLDEFRNQYARAREAQADHWADEIIEIADEGINDWMEREGKRGETQVVCDHEHVNRSRLRVDARKWLMAKAAPKKYGDKITQEVTGKDGAELIPVINLSLKNK